MAIERHSWFCVYFVIGCLTYLQLTSIDVKSTDWLEGVPSQHSAHTLPVVKDMYRAMCIAYSTMSPISSTI